MVKASNLRGRGGAGFPTGLKWTFLPKDHPGPIYICINADESEPGTFNNRMLMEDDPHQVLEGIILSCYATRATTAYIYLRYEYPLCLRADAGGHRRVLRGRLPGQEHPRQRVLARHLSPSRRRGLYLRRRDRADRKPRRQAGLAADQAAVSRRRRAVPQADGRQQHRNVACVTHIVDRGVDWFSSIGVPPDPNNPRDPGSYGPKLYCLSGHVNKPGCYEAPLGITCRQLIDEYGGGVWKGRKAKAAIPGGISMGLMTEAEFDTPLDFAGPGKVGCLGLGTAAVMVLDETVSMVDFLHNSCRFFAHESCGQCTPCREGTHWALRMLDRIKAGQGRLKDLDLLLEIGDSIGIIPGTTICGLADGAAWPIKNAIRKFRGEFEEYIKRTNPSGYMETEAVEALPVLRPLTNDSHECANRHD